MSVGVPHEEIVMAAFEAQHWHGSMWSDLYKLGCGGAFSCPDQLSEIVSGCLDEMEQVSEEHVEEDSWESYHKLTETLKRAVAEGFEYEGVEYPPSEEDDDDCT